MVEDPFRHDCQSVGDLRRAVDHFQEFIAGRTTPLSHGVLLRVKLDPLKAGPAGRARHVICCHRQYEAQRTRSVPRHHDNDGGRCIPSGAINVESPGRRPGLSFGADGFRAVRLRVTEPASVGAGRLQGIGRRHTKGDTLEDVRRPSSQRTNKSGADQKSAQTYDNHDSITQPKVYDNGLWLEDVVSAGARDADHAGFFRAIPRAGMRSRANGALTHPWAGSDTGASEVRRFICRPSYGGRRVLARHVMRNLMAGRRLRAAARLHRNRAPARTTSRTKAEEAMELRSSQENHGMCDLRTRVGVGSFKEKT